MTPYMPIPKSVNVAPAPEEEGKQREGGGKRQYHGEQQLILTPASSAKIPKFADAAVVAGC